MKPGDGAERPCVCEMQPDGSRFHRPIRTNWEVSMHSHRLLRNHAGLVLIGDHGTLRKRRSQATAAKGADVAYAQGSSSSMRLLG